MGTLEAQQLNSAALRKICEVLNASPEYFLSSAQDAQPSTNAVRSHKEHQPPLELALERIKDDETRAKMRSLLEELRKRDEA